MEKPGALSYTGLDYFLDESYTVQGFCLLFPIFRFFQISFQFLLII